MIEALQRGAAFLRAVLSLAQAEVEQGLSRLVRGVVLGVVALFCLFLSLVFLLVGGTLFIVARGVAADVAFASVGGGLLAIVALLAIWARSLLWQASIVPSRALTELNATLRAVRDAPARE